MSERSETAGCPHSIGWAAGPWPPPVNTIQWCIACGSTVRFDMQTGGWVRVQDSPANQRLITLEEAARRLLACVDTSVATADLPATHTLKLNAESLRAVLDG